jgi:HEAT repeat protein
MTNTDLHFSLTHRSAPFCIELLIEQLQSDDGVLRMKARDTLVKIGKPAACYIIPLLNHRDKHLRWEACKTLGHIRDPKTARDIALLLTDEDMDVRWVAADALIELEHHAVEAVLEQIEENFDSPMLRESAHHVLHQLKQLRMLNEMEEEVLNALKVTELPSKAAFAANKVLDHLRTAQPVTRRHLMQ